MSKKEINLDEVRDECKDFPSNFESVLIATVGTDGTPNASYAAYLQIENDYYVYVSELSRHTENLRETGKASLLFIEDEDQASHLFARQRLTYDCTVTSVRRESTHFPEVLDAFEDKFGSFIQMLRDLKDFQLFCIQPTKGSFVRGFAQAFALKGEGMQEISHRNDRGHKPMNKGSEQALNDEVA